MSASTAVELVAEARSLAAGVRESPSMVSDLQTLARAIELVALAVAALAEKGATRGLA